MVSAATASLASLTADVSAGRIHAALVVQPGATAALAAALAAPGRDLSNTTAFLFDEGREGPFAAGMLQSALGDILAAASAAAERQLRNCSAKAAPVLSARVTALHPVRAFGENSAASDSLIMAWVLMAEVMSDMLAMYSTWEQSGVRRDDQIAAQLVHLAAAAACLSLWPPVVLQCLGVRLSAATFFALWAWFALMLNTFGLVITALFTSGLSPQAAGKAHLLLLILNLVSSGGLMPAPLEPSFYRIRLALPFGNAVAGARTILFGSHNTLGANAGVLVAWRGAPRRTTGQRVAPGVLARSCSGHEQHRPRQHQTTQQTTPCFEQRERGVAAPLDEQPAAPSQHRRPSAPDGGCCHFCCSTRARVAAPHAAASRPCEAAAMSALLLLRRSPAVLHGAVWPRHRACSSVADDIAALQRASTAALTAARRAGDAPSPAGAQPAGAAPPPPQEPGPEDCCVRRARACLSRARCVRRA